MTDQTKTEPMHDQTEDRMSFFQRMAQNHGDMLEAACAVAYALMTKQPVDIGQRQVVDKAVNGIAENEKGHFNGDMIALSLTGMLRYEDLKVEDEMKQLQGPDGIDGLRAKHADKPLNKWPKQDRDRIFELETQVDKLVDKIDLGERAALVVLGQNGGNHVKAFSALRHAAGITRSCFYKDGDEVKRDLGFARRTQDSVRMLLQMVGEPTEERVPEAEKEKLPKAPRKFLAALEKRAVEDTKRQQSGVVGWAVRFFTGWLKGKEIHEDPTKFEAADRIAKELAPLEDELTVAETDLKAITNPTVHAAANAALQPLRDRVASKRTELEQYTQTDRTSVVEDASGRVEPTDPMPGNTPRVEETIETESSATLPTDVQELTGTIERIMVELGRQKKALETHQTEAERLNREAKTESNKGKKGRLLTQAADHEEKIPEVEAEVTRLTTKLETLEAKLKEITPAETDPPVMVEMVDVTAQVPTRKNFIAMITGSDLLSEDIKKELKRQALSGQLAEAHAAFVEATTPKKVDEETDELAIFIAEVAASAIDGEFKVLITARASEDMVDARQMFADVQ